jgi:hypothetical protein
MEDHGEG